jgi:uncharacterized membrane protein
MKQRRNVRYAFAILSVAVLVVLFSLASPPAAAQNPATVGQWSSVQSWPVEAIHLNLLPNGKVMFWGGYDTSTTPYIWDPITNTLTAAAAAPYPLFCAGHVQLADGELIVLGGLAEGAGVNGVAYAWSYNYSTNTWETLPDMNQGRYYPTATTLPNGNVLVTAGIATTGNDTLPQIWDVPTWSWINLSSANLSLPTYPEMFVAPNGNVFNSGPTPLTRYLNLTANGGTGAWSTVATTNAATMRDYGPAVMYSPGQILIVGGGRPPLATAETINLNAATPTWSYTGSMAYPRRQTNATILADGTVLVTGGSSNGCVAGTTCSSSNVAFDDYTNPVYPAELWNPATGTFTVMASITRYRGYHSTALLLPDGRVVSAGGDKSCANQGTGVCLFPSAEIYSPPYLFQGPQPTITSAPASVTYGQTFFVQTPNAASITQATWIRLSTVTHTFNESQRINFLSFSQDPNGQGLDVTAPANSNLAPPGYYMLFILSSGVPSVAAIVQIQNQSSSNPTFTISATPSSQTVVQGSGTTYTATITGLYGFSDGVTLSASGLPSGAGTTFSPPSVTGSGTSTMSVTTSATTPPGTYTITVTGTDSGTEGAPAQNTSVTLVVTSSNPTFTISATPASQTVVQGSGTTYTATITGSNGFSDGVTLSASGLPSGAGATFSPPSVTGSGTSTMSVTTSATTPPGTYTITVTGTDSGTEGAPAQNTSVTLVVTSSAGANFTISASPASLTLKRGANGSYTVTVTALNGFAGTVKLSVSGLPANTVSAFKPTTITGSGNATLAVGSQTTASTGTSTITITGTSGGQVQSTTVSLTLD